jgi:hypothetical protein
MRLLITILSTLCIAQLIAQQPDFQWVKNLGGAGTDVGLSVATDQNGNVFMCGRFTGTVDLDPGSSSLLVTSNGGFDMCVIKLDADGNLLWAKTTGGADFDQFSDIAIDAEGNCILSGSFSGTVQPDPNDEFSILNATGSEETLVLKLDSNGNTLWYHHTESTSYTVTEGLAIDTDNSIYLAGSHAGTTQFNPITEVVNAGSGLMSNITSQGENDVFLFKLLADGSFEWVRTAGSTSFDAAKDVAIDNQNNVNVIGRFRLTIDFDVNGGGQTAVSEGLNDCFLWQVSSAGIYHWHKTFGAEGFDEVWAVDTDPEGNVLTYGYFTGTVDLDPGVLEQSFTSNGSDDLFVQKFDSAGEMLWVKVYGGSELENSYDIACDEQGNVVLTGDFFDTVDFDPGIGVTNLTSSGNNDIFFMQLNPEGEFDWAFKIGATFSQAGYSVTIDDNGNVFGTGTYSNLVDFDPGSGVANINAQDFNIYIVKFGWECLLPELSDVTASLSAICLGESVSASINGSLNGGSEWQLRAGNCDGEIIASTTASSIEFSPQTNQSYFIRSFGGCAASEQDVCLQIALTVLTPSETTESHTVCEGTTFVFPDGSSVVISEYTTQTSVLANQAGCDSVVVTYVNVPFLPDDLNIQVDGTILEVVNYPSKSNIELQWVDCNNNNAPIEGETGLTFNIPGSGSYAVVYSDQGCSKMTDCVVITSVQEGAPSRLTVFPNPSEQGFFIQNIEDDFMDINLFGADGKLVFSLLNHPSQAMVTLPQNASSGLYFVEVRSRSVSARFRLVKK